MTNRVLDIHAVDGYHLVRHGYFRGGVGVVYFVVHVIDYEYARPIDT